MTPALEKKIRMVVPSIINGWCSADKAIDLANAVLELKSDLSVEIGVFGGRSLLPIALAHAAQDHGQVWAIDAWSAQVSAAGEVPANVQWWGNLNHEPIYLEFLSLIKKYGVEKYVKVFRKRSDDVEPPEVIDFLHLDGSHTEQAVKDAERYASRVRKHGLAFADDCAWVGGGVQRAVEKMVGMGFVQISARDTGGMFVRNMGDKVEIPPPVAPPEEKPDKPVKAEKKAAKKKR